jgi:hypothetical protein
MAEFRARHFGGPVIYASPNQNSPFEGLPMEAVARMGADGLGGMQFYFNHFLQWEGPVAEGSAGGWTLTDGTGTSTIAYGDSREGSIVLTADATSGADCCLQLGSATVGKQFGYTVGKRLACFARYKTSSIATGRKHFLGFGTPTTTPGVTAPTNGIFLRNGTAVATLDLVAKEGSNSTAKTSQITLAANTYYVSGFLVDATGNLHLYHNGSEIAAALIAVGSTGLATLNGDATKTLQFIVDHVLASATLTLDWLLIGQDV